MDPINLLSMFFLFQLGLQSPFFIQTLQSSSWCKFFFWEYVQCFCKKISTKPSLIFCIECPPHSLLHIFMKMHNFHILATKPIILKIHNSAGNDRCNLFHAIHSYIYIITFLRKLLSYFIEEHYSRFFPFVFVKVR